jgi:hypothetical protein
MSVLVLTILASKTFTNCAVALVDVDTSPARIYGYEILVAVGSGAFIQAGYATIQTVVDPSDMGYAIP